jgi:hypothetical protein
LCNGEQKIERELVSTSDALRVAILMLARRGRLEIGDVLGLSLIASRVSHWPIAKDPISSISTKL